MHFLLFQLCYLPFNSLPNNKISDQSQLKDFAENKINVSQKLKIFWGKEENIVGRGENVGFFSFYHKIFKSCLFQGC